MKMSKLLVPVLAVSVMLAGCGGAATANYIKENYNLENVEGEGNATQKVYRAEGESVPDVAHKIADQQKPDEISKDDEKSMFLVYRDEVIHVQEDEGKPEDTLVEVDSKEFVRRHYNPSFLEGFLAASIISSMFGSNWRSGSYGGYSGYGKYKYSGGYAPGNPGAGRVTPAPNTGGSKYTTPPKSSKGSGRVIRR